MAVMVLTRVPSSSRYAPIIGFSAAARAGDLVFVAGTTAVDQAGEIVGGADPYAQSVESLRKIVAALAELGVGPEQVVCTRMYLARARDWAEVGRAHGELFGGTESAGGPAATMVVSGLLDPRMLVEIEAVAYAPS
jgi:enamine deaminase RidA (YjgF/YER057c/UK114 family)